MAEKAVQSLSSRAVQVAASASCGYMIAGGPTAKTGRVGRAQAPRARARHGLDRSSSEPGLSDAHANRHGDDSCCNSNNNERAPRHGDSDTEIMIQPAPDSEDPPAGPGA